MFQPAHVYSTKKFPNKSEKSSCAKKNGKIVRLTKGVFVENRCIIIVNFVWNLVVSIVCIIIAKDVDII